MQQKTTISVGLGLGVFFIEGFVLNQGVVAGAALFLVGVSIFILCLRRLFGKIDPSVFSDAFVRKVRFALLAGLGLVMMVVNGEVARTRATKIIAACESYKQKNGQYPITLPALVPEFLEKIPNANFRLYLSGFTYMANPERHQLIYVVLPPYGREYYSLEEKRWGMID